MVEMKESGITWCGDIPAHWQIMANKYIMLKKKEICPIYKGQDILSLTMNGVIVRNLEAGGKMPTSFDGYQKIYPNNLLMCLFDYDVTPRCIGLIKNEGLTSPAYSQFIMKNENSSRYYYYYYLMIDNTKELLHLAKNLRHSFTEDQLGAIKTPVPPLDEQNRIAEFLDDRCAEIDAISSEIQEQINTLEEYKKSVITDAVTKGLNPNAEMKDSGAKWIGKIPTSWEIKKGKYCLEYIEKPTKEDDEVITCFRDGEVTLRKNRREDGFTISEKEIGYQGIDVGDLIVHGMDGFAGAIGISDSRGKASPVLNVLGTNQNKQYIMYYLRSMAYNGVFIALATGIRVRTCDTNWGKLKELPYPLPSLKEQEEIVAYINNVLNQTNNIIADKQQQLEILEEYKKTLIYEYVTGKKEVA